MTCRVYVGEYQDRITGAAATAYVVIDENGRLVKAMAQKVKTNKGLSLQAVNWPCRGCATCTAWMKPCYVWIARQRLQLYGRNAAQGQQAQNHRNTAPPCGDTVPRNIGACNRVCPQRRRQYVGTVRGDPQEILQPDSPAVRTAGKYIVTH